jgi:hypothetical protein
MKRMYSILFKWTLLLSLFQFSACRKLEDLILSGQTGGLPACKVETITSNNVGENYTNVFTYDNHGNPLGATVSPAGMIRSTLHYIFRYDQNHRLADWIGLSTDSSYYFFWHKYKYNAKSQIVQDSLYRDGSFSEDPKPVGHENELIVYTYDSQDRMTSALTYEGTALIYHNTYQYDQDGNLVRPGMTYDRKVNPHQTNKIWMFLDQEYSVNNSFPAIKYNQEGLPLKFNLPVEIPYPTNSDYFVGIELNVSTITYSCK